MAKKTIKKNSKARIKSSKSTSWFSSRFVGAVAVLSMFGVVATYVSVVNASAVKGDEIRDLERRIASAQESAENLSVKEAQLRAFVAPAEDAQFVAVDASKIRVISMMK